MSELEVGDIWMPTAELGGENPLPPLDGCLPHRRQDRYGRRRFPRRFKSVFLENEILRATFLPELGGRLWSLIHKPTNRELLYVNPVFQPCNLAIRNAWFSGGVEWNIGTIGHAAHTCAPLFVATLRDRDGTPVLRMYEWDRIRQVPFQMDFFLPDGSAFLMARIRIVNPNAREVPMYWWSNIAVPERTGSRVLAPASSAYRHGYQGKMELAPVPCRSGVDYSYPESFNRSEDNFFCIEPGRQPWITVLDEHGVGLVQTSTARLKGRKLFVWGMGQGGRHWQEFLSVPNAPYIEIQAGLATTQGEYLPMPAGAVWEWIEAYGRIQVDPRQAHGQDWQSACDGVESSLQSVQSADMLDQLMQATAAMAASPPDHIIQMGSGWGALEQRRRSKAGEPRIGGVSLVFDDRALGTGQHPWLELLEHGSLPCISPVRFAGEWMVQSEWRALLEDSVATANDHWLTWLHLGVMFYHDGHFPKARQAWEKSLSMEPSAWAYRNLGHLSRKSKRYQACLQSMLMAVKMLPEEPALVIECCQAFLDADKPLEMMEFIDQQPETIRGIGRMRMLEARAALQRDDLDRVRLILESRPVVQDVREGEVSLSDLWFEWQARLVAATGNRKLDAELLEEVRHRATPPAWLDFRQSD